MDPKTGGGNRRERLAEWAPAVAILLFHLAFLPGYGVFRDGRMVIFYSYNTDLGDGWEDADVHDDPPAKREAALKMGVNVVLYALTH